MIQTLDGGDEPVLYVSLGDFAPRAAPRDDPFPLEGAFLAAFSDRDFAELVKWTLPSAKRDPLTHIVLHRAIDLDITVAAQVETEIRQSESFAANLDSCEGAPSDAASQHIGRCVIELKRHVDELLPVYQGALRKQKELLAKGRRAIEKRSPVVSMAWLSLGAQGYCAMLSHVVKQMAHALDPQMNDRYLWLVGSIQSLLKDEKVFEGSGLEFEPFLPDLLPSTVRDVDWEYMVQPAAEAFLGDVQRFLASRRRSDPAEGSSDWAAIEILRSEVDECVVLAQNYAKRMRAAWRGIIQEPAPRDGSVRGDASPKPSEPVTGDQPQSAGANDAVAHCDETPRVNAEELTLHFRGQTYQFGKGLSFKLLERLTKRPGSNVRVDTLIQDIWERQEGGSANKKTVQTAVTRLRKKLKQLNVDGLLINGSTRGCYAIETIPRSSQSVTSPSPTCQRAQSESPRCE